MEECQHKQNTISRKKAWEEKWQKKISLCRLPVLESISNTFILLLKDSRKYFGIDNLTTYMNFSHIFRLQFNMSNKIYHKETNSQKTSSVIKHHKQKH